MRLVQITPGAGGMYCGNCFRDNALVSELNRAGHETLMVPLYLPLTLDEDDESRETPVFFSGVSVYLDQVFPWFRRAPEWLRSWTHHPAVLHWASHYAARTRADQVADLTISMLRGSEGNQSRDLDELIGWLGSRPKSDAVMLSNALLLGLAPRLRRDLGTRVICHLQGEAAYVDSMPPAKAREIWGLLREKSEAVDRFVAPSQYFAETMGTRLGVTGDRMRVVSNGIRLEGYPTPGAPGGTGIDRTTARPTGKPFTLGYFTRMCRDKGLDTLVEAFIHLRRDPGLPRTRLRIGGGCGPSDEAFVSDLQRRLEEAGLTADVDWVRNPDRTAKIEFLRSLDLFSVPARSGEAFGLYLIEALAAGVPVVQPRTAAFPELIEATQGGILFEPENVEALAGAVTRLLADPGGVRRLGDEGQKSVFARFHVGAMARGLVEVLTERKSQPSPTEPQEVR